MGVPAMSAEMLGRTGRRPDPAEGRPRSGAEGGLDGGAGVSTLGHRGNDHLEASTAAATSGTTASTAGSTSMTRECNQSQTSTLLSHRFADQILLSTALPSLLTVTLTVPTSLRCAPAVLPSLSVS